MSHSSIAILKNSDATTCWFNAAMQLLTRYVVSKSCNHKIELRKVDLVVWFNFDFSAIVSILHFQFLNVVFRLFRSQGIMSELKKIVFQMTTFDFKLMQSQDSMWYHLLVWDAMYHHVQQTKKLKTDGPKQIATSFSRGWMQKAFAKQFLHLLERQQQDSQEGILAVLSSKRIFVAIFDFHFVFLTFGSLIFG